LPHYVHGATYVDEVAVLHDFSKNAEYAFELNDTYSVVGLVGRDGRLIRGYEYDVYGRRREINTHWDFLIGIRNHLGESATGELAKYDVTGDGNIDLRDLTKARIPPELPSYQPWGFQGRIRCSYKTSGPSPQTVTIYDFRARFYDPTHGRFLQRDPAEYADSYNLYLAFLSNPLTKQDPMGLSTDTPENHLYPRAFGGHPNGPGSALPIAKHQDYHNYIMDELGRLSGHGGRLPYGAKAREVWVSIGEEMQRQILVGAANKVGINVADPEFQKALDEAFDMSRNTAGTRQKHGAVKLYEFKEAPTSKGQRIVTDRVPGLNKLRAIGIGIAVAGYALQGVNTVASMDPHSPYMREMMMITLKARESGDISMLDEVAVLEDLYHVTNCPYAAAYGWNYWRDKLWK